MDSVIQINPGATKWDIRQKVWDYIEAKNLANFPRPVHNRIPNFKGASQAGDRLPAFLEFKSSKVIKVNPDRPQQQARYVTLDVFQKTGEVKVDPDKPLEGARLAVLQAGKTLLVPTPRLRSGLFNRIVPPPGASKEDLRVCSSSQGVKEYSVPIGLEAKVQVDLVVVGSVAVSEKGYRIGKGEGFADMEYAMMVSMGAVTHSTVVVTIVHDCQVVDIPEDLIESHDLTVDYVLTPTRVIQTECRHPKPQGIIWAKLVPGMLEKIPVLKKLRELERQAGKDVTLGKVPAETVAQRTEQELLGELQEKGGIRDDGQPQQRERRASTTLYLGNIPPGLRVSELKIALRERGAQPLRLNWQGAQHRAFLDYSGREAAEAALAALQGLSIDGTGLQAELAKSQRSSRKPGQTRSRATTGLAEAQNPSLT